MAFPINKSGATKEITRRIARSKYATDVMFRLWDAYNSCWVTVSSRTVWAKRSSVERIRDGLIVKGRDPNHLTVERVMVEVK